MAAARIRVCAKRGDMNEIRVARAPADSLDPGVPSVERVLAGEVE